MMSRCLGQSDDEIVRWRFTGHEMSHHDFGFGVHDRDLLATLEGDKGIAAVGCEGEPGPLAYELQGRPLRKVWWPHRMDGEVFCTDRPNFLLIRPNCQSMTALKASRRQPPQALDRDETAQWGTMCDRRHDTAFLNICHLKPIEAIHLLEEEGLIGSDRSRLQSPSKWDVPHDAVTGCEVDNGDSFRPAHG